MWLRSTIVLAVLLPVGTTPVSRGEVVAPLTTYSNPIPISGEKFGRFAYSDGTDAFVSDSDAREDGMTGAVYQFNLTTGALIRTFGSPEGANEVNFGDEDAIATLGDNLLVGDWGARRQIHTNGTVSFGGLGYRFSISSGEHLETYSPVGRPNLGGGAYALGISGVGDRVIVGWDINRALEIFDAAGGFLVRHGYLFLVTGFGSPIKPLGTSVVVGTGGNAGPNRAAYVVDVATGAILGTMPDPRPTGAAISSIFGEAIATNAAGTRILVGAYRANTQANTGVGPGAAYLFDASGNLLRAIDAPPGAGGFFGWDVEFLGDDLLVGAPANNGTTGVVVLVDADTGSVLRQYEGYGIGWHFGFSLGAVDSSRFLVGSLAGEAYLLPGLPTPNLTGAVSRKNCDLPIDLSGETRTSEPRQGGVTEMCFTYDDAAPSGTATIEAAACPAPPVYGPYGGTAIVACSPVGNNLCCTFTPGLENGRTYRLTVPSGSGTAQVELSGLLGDANSDGAVNGADRSVVVGAWTGPGYTCATDLNSDGVTNGADRSLVVGAWTGPGTCAP